MLAFFSTTQKVRNRQEIWIAAHELAAPQRFLLLPVQNQKAVPVASIRDMKP